jgi:glycosyltransferase involved in cell wall biosynthesis
LKSDTWLVIAAYNEQRVIGDVVSGLTSLPYNVVVVDDGSADATARAALQHPVFVLRHTCNLGQGAALQTGLTFALQFPQTRYLVTFDADGQHSAADVPRLLAPLRDGSYDVTLGSRFLRPGDAVNIGARKRLLLQAAVAFIKLTTGLAVTDAHNGLRAFTADAARRIVIRQNRMAHASEILAQIAALELRYCEVPVTIKYTEYSVAKGQAILDSINILWDTVKGELR